jgi:hypothetical protein
VPETIPHVAAGSLAAILTAFLVSASSIFPARPAHARDLALACPTIWSWVKKRPGPRFDIAPRSVIVDEGPVESDPGAVELEDREPYVPDRPGFG